MGRFRYRAVQVFGTCWFAPVQYSFVLSKQILSGELIAYQKWAAATPTKIHSNRQCELMRLDLSACDQIT